MARLGVVYAPKALKDINLILRHSAEQWGGRQMLVYAERLDKAMDLLSEFPESGPADARLRKKQRLYHFGSHTIVYSIRDGDIHVARVLHQNMDLRRHV